MMRWTIVAAMIGVGIVSGAAFATREMRALSRVERARARAERLIRGRFDAAGVPYPAPALLLRAFKKEHVLELWGGARSGPLKPIAQFPICRLSGRLGPKRRMGDGQVPEGFYVVDQFNPQSQYHLSFRVAYPNASDRIRGAGGELGGDIYVHGDCVSIGCLAMGNEAIEELYLALWDSHRAFHATTPIHIFPRRLDDSGWSALQNDARFGPELRSFWSELRSGFLAFESEHQVPEIAVDARGVYRLR